MPDGSRGCVAVHPAAGPSRGPGNTNSVSLASQVAWPLSFSLLSCKVRFRAVPL